MKKELVDLIPNDVEKHTVITLLGMLMEFGTPESDIKLALSLIQAIHAQARSSVAAYKLRLAEESHEEKR